MQNLVTSQSRCCDSPTSAVSTVQLTKALSHDEVSLEPQLFSCESLSPAQLFVTPWAVAHQAPLPMNSRGKNTGVGSHFLFQGIFLTQGSNLGLLHCRQILYHLSYREAPHIVVCICKYQYPNSSQPLFLSWYP